MNNTYEIEMNAYSRKKFKVSAENAKEAVDFMLNSFFNSDTVCFNDCDIDVLEIDAKDENGKECCECRGFRDGAVFNISF